MKRLLLRSIAVLISGMVVAAAIVYWMLISSLPQLDGVIEVSDLQSDASIERDAAGIPTITAKNRLDLAFATGFAHGQDRFFQMDLSRRRAAGELAELLGSGLVDFDKRSRLHRFRHRAGIVIDRSPAADGALLEAYASGVNAGLDSLGAAPFEYLLLREDPQPWTVEDCILVGYAMFLTLNDERARRDVRRGLAHSVLPQQVYEWMYPRGSEWDSPSNINRTPFSFAPSLKIYRLLSNLLYSPTRLVRPARASAGFVSKS